MADRPTASTFKAGRPRTRSRSAHLPSCIPKAVRPRTKSAQRTQVKGKGKDAGKGKSTKKKSGKPVAVVSSDSEHLEVDFLNHPPNQTQVHWLNNLKDVIHQHTFQLRNNKNKVTH